MTPQTAVDYSPDHLALVKRACLTVLPAMRDLAESITIVGGMVPSLLMPETLPTGVQPHVGTVDLDLGLTIGVGEASNYRRLIERLTALDFVAEGENRWALDGSQGPRAIIDVLPLLEKGVDNTIEGIPQLDDRMTSRLRLAFCDRQRIKISGPSLSGDQVTANAWVCGPGAFVIIKALVYNQRHLSKDAYDLFYVLRNFGTGIGEVVAHVALLMQYAESRQAMQILEDRFLDENEEGPLAVTGFLFRRPDAEIQADVAGYVRALLVGCGWLSPG